MKRVLRLLGPSFSSSEMPSTSSRPPMLSCVSILLSRSDRDALLGWSSPIGDAWASASSADGMSLAPPLPLASFAPPLPSAPGGTCAPQLSEPVSSPARPSSPLPSFPLHWARSPASAFCCAWEGVAEEPRAGAGRPSPTCRWAHAQHGSYCWVPVCRWMCLCASAHDTRSGGNRGCTVAKTAAPATFAAGAWPVQAIMTAIMVQHKHIVQSIIIVQNSCCHCPRCCRAVRVACKGQPGCDCWGA